MSENRKPLRKYNIGTARHPYPMVYSFQNEEGRTQYDLGVLQSDENPLPIYSEKEFTEVVGRMYRDMPTPSMLEVFKQGQLQRLPEHKRKVEFFMGDAGAGKSFLASLNAKMRTDKGAVLFDCGGRDLSDLLYETVLDYESGKNVYDAIDEKLANGTLNPASVGKLRAALGNAFSEQDGKVAIDWSELGVARADEEALEAKAAQHQKRLGLSNDDLRELDAWESADDKTGLSAPSEDSRSKYSEYKQAIDSDSKALYTQAETQRDNALAAVREVAALEGLDKGEDVSIGLKTRKGAIIQAWEENRPIVLDEYNKGKPGTDDALQILWQVFTGEMDSHTISKGGESFTFDRKDMPSNFFVTLTGNKTRDGYSTRSLSASAYQRLKPHYIEAPTVEDLQHRICQKLTGMPVSTIYHAQEEYWSENKDQFTDFLVNMRKRGLSEEQQANIPSWQFEMLKNWENVVQASEQLATLYDQWSQVIDPDSKLHEESPAQVSSILSEIDKQYAAEVGVGLRRMMSHLDEAELIVPEAIPGKASQGVDPNTDWDQPDELDESAVEPIEQRYGSRLSKVILKDINATAIGKDALLTWMLKKAAEAGLFDMQLEEGKTTGDRLLADLLDLDPEKEKEIPENIEQLHGVLCEYLRDKFPDIDPDVPDSDIISPSKLEHVLTQLGGQKEVERMTHRSGVVHLPSDDLDSDIPFTSRVSTQVSGVIEPRKTEGADYEQRKEIYDEIQKQEEGLENLEALPTEQLVDAERYLISLAIPSVKQNNIEAVFSKHRHEIDNEDNAHGLEINHISNNKSDTGLAVGTLLSKTRDADGTERNEYLYVIHDNFAKGGEGRTLVTGTTEISPRLQTALENGGVTYVNRNSPDAATKIDAALGEIIAEKSDILLNPNDPAQSPRDCIEHVLCAAISNYVKFEDEEKIDAKGRVTYHYDMPHGDIFFQDDAPAFVTDDLRGKHRENLVSILSDERELLTKSTRVQPVYLTDSPDIDHLKNTVRSLTHTGGQKQMGIG